jgi:hypothetical protein
MKSRLWLAACGTAVLGVALALGPAAAGMKINVGSTFGPGAPVYKGQEKFSNDPRASSRSSSIPSAPWAERETSLKR